MQLSEGFKALALKLQEQADDEGALSSSDICARLRDALSDMCDQNTYCCLIDYYGDDESGEVIYSCNGDCMKAPYEMSMVNGKAVCSIDDDNAVDVMPRTVYDEQADEADHYASMESKRLYKKTPLYERFVSKDERDAADSGDFAGKGKSFPILKRQDVMAAVRSIGRAGSDNYDAGTLKRNIIRIAKRKGFASALPKAWQGGSSDSSEARRSTQASNSTGSLRLTESALTLEKIVIKEARADYPIKLIAPGKGSSAFYPREVLQRDGPKVFKTGTHVYLNHPTAAEEAQRPEGDVANLAGVLTSDAVYYEAGAKGPGLYARMKVFADHAQMVEEKAAHVGMSIRASGVAEAGRTKEGLPVLKELTSAESVDVVTRAGAGGMILTEAARPQSHEGGEQEVTLQEAQKMIEASVAPFRKRALQADAREECQRVLEVLHLPPQSKARIVERVLETDIPTKEGNVDFEKLRETLVKEAKREGEYVASLTGSGRVTGMGGGDPVDPKEAKRAKKALKEARNADEAIFRELGLSEKAAQFAVRGNAA